MSDEDKLNRPLLRKAVEWVEEQDKLPALDREWEQGSWVAHPEKRALNLAVQIAVARNEYRMKTESGTFFGPVNTEVVNAYAEQVQPHCGTAFCVAGYIGQMHDARYAVREVVDGVHVSKYAADLLGLDYKKLPMSSLGEVATPLFSGGNTAEEIRSIAEELAGEKL